MIRHTFSVASGIGERLERHLWKNGILTWSDFLESEYVPGIPREKKIYLDRIFDTFERALSRNDSEFFAFNLKRREHWRLFSELRGRVLCLDIETNGYQPGKGGYVTVVGLYDGIRWEPLIRGENLTRQNLQMELDRADMIITFYGSSFDIPFLLQTFPGLRINKPHFDLCYGARRLGLKGGLKRLETYFGIKREEEVQGLDGYDAVILWQMYRRGSKEALELLLEYNKEDTVNLLNLSEIIYDGLRKSTGIDNYKTENKISFAG